MYHSVLTITLCEIKNSIAPILQMRALKHREIQQLVGIYVAGTWQDQLL